jgi:hypothetical protein
MMFTIEFFRIREKDNAHAMLDRITHIASDLESAKVKAKSLFDTLNLLQNPDGLHLSPPRSRGSCDNLAKSFHQSNVAIATDSGSVNVMYSVMGCGRISST